MNDLPIHKFILTTMLILINEYNNLFFFLLIVVLMKFDFDKMFRLAGSLH